MSTKISKNSDPLNPDTGKKHLRNAPFNRFIREQWSMRNDELRLIAKQHGSSSVMKLLGSEWKALPRKPDVDESALDKTCQPHADASAG
jgi:hypothetical protein